MSIGKDSPVEQEDVDEGEPEPVQRGPERAPEVVRVEVGRPELLLAVAAALGHDDQLLARDLPELEPVTWEASTKNVDSGQHHEHTNHPQKEKARTN